MKPAPFDYARPASLSEAIGLLAGTADAKVLAGGQTLGPMLNLRLAQPTLLVDITRIAELAAVHEHPDTITLGATVTHAAIEDGRIADPTRGFLPRVAQGIAYRAVRTRGTIGGSLAHADPAADWLACLTALGADVVAQGQRGERRIPVAQLVRGAMDTDLGHDEVIAGIRIPRFSKEARFGYHKICRKTGEFAEAIGVAVHEPARNLFRLVTSTPGGKPIMLQDGAFPSDASELKRRLAAADLSRDAYEMNVHTAALQRAIVEAQAP
jgi:carbon-monoxide dehydrogenase medium subunit